MQLLSFRHAAVENVCLSDSRQGGGLLSFLGVDSRHAGSGGKDRGDKGMAPNLVFCFCKKNVAYIVFEMTQKTVMCFAYCVYTWVSYSFYFCSVFSCIHCYFFMDCTNFPWMCLDLVYIHVQMLFHSDISFESENSSPKLACLGSIRIRCIN